MINIKLLITYHLIGFFQKQEIVQFKKAVLKRNFFETVNYATNQAETATSLQLSPLIGICPYLSYGFRCFYVTTSIAI
jgi:hypothetical protein